LMSSAVAGFGVVMQPAELVEPYINSGKLLKILENYRIPSRPLHIVYAPDRRITPKLRSFLDFAINAFG